MDEPETIGGKALERGEVAGVRELVEHGHGVLRVREDVVDEVGADEAGTAGHEEI